MLSLLKHNNDIFLQSLGQIDQTSRSVVDNNNITSRFYLVQRELILDVYAPKHFLIGLDYVLTSYCPLRSADYPITVPARPCLFHHPPTPQATSLHSLLHAVWCPHQKQVQPGLLVTRNHSAGNDVVQLVTPSPSKCILLGFSEKQPAEQAVFMQILHLCGCWTSRHGLMVCVGLMVPILVTFW